MGGKKKEGRGRREGDRVGREGKGKGGDVEGPGKWSAPGPALALGGPVTQTLPKACVWQGKPELMLCTNFSAST